jgi:hypothetical protein
MKGDENVRSVEHRYPNSQELPGGTQTAAVKMKISDVHFRQVRNPVHILPEQFCDGRDLDDEPIQVAIGQHFADNNIDIGLVGR